MHLDDLRARIADLAKGGDFPGWELFVYESFARIKVTTPTTFGTAHEAFAAAEVLCGALLGDDLELHYQARLGAHSDDGEDSPTSWSGIVEIGVRDKGSAAES